MPRIRKVDNNQNEVVNKLRDLGFSVGLTHTVGNGFPDFVVGFDGINFLVELKSNGNLTKHEVQFFSSWLGQVNKCYTVDDILDSLLCYLCLVDGFNISYRQLKLNDIHKRYIYEKQSRDL